MLFNSYEFLLLFLPITLVVFYLLLKLNKETIVVSWLVVASIAFYSWFDPRFLILLGVSIIFNFVMSIFIRQARISENSEVKRKIFSSKVLLTIAIVANLLVLMYYKYFLFIVANLNSFLQQNIVVDNIVLPIGISFFTFTQIAFLGLYVKCWGKAKYVFLSRTKKVNSIFLCIKTVANNRQPI